jgi:hypothetical protein
VVETPVLDVTGAVEETMLREEKRKEGKKWRQNFCILYLLKLAAAAA